MAILPERERIRKHMASTGGDYSRHNHGGNCHICGSVNLIYSILYYHAKSNSYIRMGEDCASKLDFGGTREMNIFRKAVREEMEIAKGKAKAQRVLGEAGLSRAWEIAQETDRTGFIWEENTITDIVSKLVQYGSISEKQEAFLHKLIGKIDSRAAVAAQRAEENEAAADCPTGRVTVTGVILSTRTQEGDYGTTFKMLVRDATGFKVWATCPNWNAQKGDLVTFSVKLTPSDRDAKFGFGSRPTKFDTIKSAADTAAA